MYWRSTDPEVIEAVKRNKERREEHRKAVFAWAEERGKKEYFPSTWGGMLSVRGLPGKVEGFGQWTQMDNYGMTRPFKSNKVEWELMRSLTTQLEDVPGVPRGGSVHSVTDERTGQSWFITLRPWLTVEGDAVWMATDKQLEPSSLKAIGEQWVEEKASTYYAAAEAYEAHIKEKEDGA